ncbi:MAG: DeoR/GlpR transcriptional regulator [Thermomicrobiales bacterium]|nr:DeoR/GlpR transcriptional regulator [Thermomicrobiales bacterium]
MSHYSAGEHRLERIRAFVEREQRTTVDDIAKQFELSTATARRALVTLAARGDIARFRGGALAIPGAGREHPALQRQAEQRQEKERIGKAAADLVADGETVFLGSGTTTLEVARHLGQRRNLAVLTNSLLVIEELASSPDITVIALGGMLRRSEYSFIGHLVEQALQEIRAAKVIMGIRAVHPEQGLMNDFLPETLTDRAIVKLAREVIVVADHTKCGRVAPTFVAPVVAMHTLVTDSAVPDAFAEALRTNGITVVRA